MLRVHTRNLGDAAVLSLQGRLISGETRTLREAVRAQADAKAIVLDLGRVTAIDAYGLGLMLELRRLSDTKGVRFKLMNVSKFTSRVFEVTRLDSVFENYSQSRTVARARSTNPRSHRGLRVIWSAPAESRFIGTATALWVFSPRSNSRTQKQPSGFHRWAVLHVTDSVPMASYLLLCHRHRHRALSIARAVAGLDV
jgi:anti-anti-sigma factor